MLGSEKEGHTHGPIGAEHAGSLRPCKAEWMGTQRTDLEAHWVQEQRAPKGKLIDLGLVQGDTEVTFSGISQACLFTCNRTGMYLRLDHSYILLLSASNQRLIKYCSVSNETSVSVMWGECSINCWLLFTLLPEWTTPFQAWMKHHFSFEECEQIFCYVEHSLTTNSFL